MATATADLTHEGTLTADEVDVITLEGREAVGWHSAGAFEAVVAHNDSPDPIHVAIGTDPVPGGASGITIEPGQSRGVWAVRDAANVAVHVLSRDGGDYRLVPVAAQRSEPAVPGVYAGASYDLAFGNIDLTATTTWAEIPEVPGAPAMRPIDVFIPNVFPGDVIEVELGLPVVMSADVDVDVRFRMRPVVAGTVLTDVDGMVPTGDGYTWNVDHTINAGGRTFVGGSVPYLVKPEMIEHGGVRMRPQYFGNWTTGTVELDGSSFLFIEAAPGVKARGPFRRQQGTCIVTSSQSLFNTPTDSPIPWRVQRMLRSDGHNVGVHHLSWSGASIDSRSHEEGLMAHATLGWERTVLMMTGGFADLAGGDTPAEIYGELATRAAAARTRGQVDAVVCMSMPDSVLHDTQQEQDDRAELNALIRADATGAFDAIIDVERYPKLNDGGTSDFYGDGIHFVEAGAEFVASKFAEAIKPYLY